MSTTLALNCWIRGDHPPSDKVFTVEIQEHKNVSTLKGAIKVQKSKTFQHVDADDLKLWLVPSFPKPIPVDDNLGETFDPKYAKPLRAVQTLSGVFSKPLDGANLHVVVTVSGENSDYFKSFGVYLADILTDDQLDVAGKSAVNGGSE
jgi:hypothetical protein